MNPTTELVTVHAPKRLDLSTAPYLEKDLDAKIREGVSLILDLTKTQFIDPPSANVVMEGLIKSRLRNARLVLRGVNPKVKVVLEMAGVLRHFRPQK